MYFDTNLPDKILEDSTGALIRLYGLYYMYI